jgi:hypothetical protein
MSEQRTPSAPAGQPQAVALGKAKDLTGQTFGRLTVQELAYRDRRRGKVQWRCICACGTAVLVNPYALTSGHTVSCGCYQAERSRRPVPTDLEGQTFGRLTAVRCLGRIADKYQQLWECRCECGKVVNVRRDGLLKGQTKSCGCYSTDLLRERTTSHGHCQHGGKTPEYTVWAVMLQRCLNPNNPKFADYGGRGINVCERWLSFKNFLADMGRRPGPGYEIDRIENDKGYGPDNCRWATRAEQMRNTRRNRFLTLGGISLCIADWAARQSLTTNTIRTRLRLGWDVESALTTPPLSKSEAARRAALAGARKRREANG